MIREIFELDCLGAEGQINNDGVLKPIALNPWCRMSKLVIIFVPNHSGPEAVVLRAIDLIECRLLCRFSDAGVDERVGR